MVETVLCVHCGAQTKHPVTKTIDDRTLNFCCGGCLQVYELLREEGLQPGQSSPGIQAAAQTDTAHPLSLQRDGRTPLRTVTITITGMTCSNCVTHVARSLRSVSGVENVEVDLATGLATVDKVPDMVTMDNLKRAVEAAGYKVSHLGDT
jgi:copper chaperone CopZ